MEDGDQTVLMVALRQEVTFGGELRPRVYGYFRGSERHCLSSHESRLVDRVGKLPAMPVSALPEHVLHYRENNHDNGTDHAPEDRYIRHYCGLCTCFA